MNIHLKNRFDRLAKSADSIYLAGGNDDGARPSEALLSSKQIALGAAILATAVLASSHELNNKDFSIKLSHSAKSFYEPTADHDIALIKAKEMDIESSIKSNIALHADDDDNHSPRT